MQGRYCGVLLIVLLGLCPAASWGGAPTGPEGRWEGDVLMQPGELEFPMSAYIERGAEGVFHGTISWPHRGLKDIPLKEIQVEGRSVFFVQTEPDGDFVFNGELSEDGSAITGQRAFQGKTSAFRLERPNTDIRRPEVLVLSNGEAQLKQLFNQDLGKVRLLVLLAPTCVNCKLNAHAVQKYVLRQIQDERLKIYVVWQTVFEKDNLEAAQESAMFLPDPRVTHLWAGTAETTGSIKSSLKLTFPPFDIFLAFPEGTKWGDSMPAPALLMHKLKDSPLPQDRMLNGIKLAEEIRELLRAGTAGR